MSWILSLVFCATQRLISRLTASALVLEVRLVDVGLIFVCGDFQKGREERFAFLCPQALAMSSWMPVCFAVRVIWRISVCFEQFAERRMEARISPGLC